MMKPMTERSIVWRFLAGLGLVLGLSLGAATLTGCEEDAGEEVGEAIDDVGDEVGDAIDDIAD